MDPNSGKIYNLSDPDISDEVRERLIEVSSADPTDEEMRAALRKEFVETEASELEDVLNKMEKLKEIPEEPEQFYPTNRAARRKADKRNRALMKRDKHG
jgi:hypothetical protein